MVFPANMVGIMIGGIAFRLVHLFPGTLAVIEPDHIKLYIIPWFQVITKFNSATPFLHVRFHYVWIGCLVGF